jgi:hypothetical protein
MDAIHQLKYPAHGGRFCWLFDLIWQCFVLDRKSFCLNRRWAIEYTNNARVMTINNPMIRLGFLRKSELTKNSGSFKKRSVPDKN